MSEDRAKISIFSHGLLYGDGLFETMRAYEGRVFRLDAHIKRLFQASKVLHLALAWSQRGLKEMVYRLINLNGLKNASIRLSICRGEGPRGIDIAKCKSPILFITARKVPLHLNRPCRAAVSHIRQNEFPPLSQIKSFNFLNQILAKIEAKERKADDAILLNTSGCIAEATTSNIFLVLKNKSLVTPSLESGILPGITRTVVIELAPQLGLKIFEKKVYPSALFDAEEAFLTNSLKEIIPLISIDDKPIGKGKPGPITKRIHQAYKKLVRGEREP